MPENTLFSYRVSEDDRELFDPKNPLWGKIEKVMIDRYWDGQSALKEHGPEWRNLTEVASVWNEDTLYFFFQCWFRELYVNPDWTTKSPIPGLWERDVVEVFLRPESCDDYFEIEISPLGQWLDIHVLKPRVDVDYGWASDLRVRVNAESDSGVWRAFLALPFAPIMQSYSERTKPLVGDAWRLNLYRMAGEEPEREYLAWCPTFTPRPDFHVPSAFGNIIFLAD